MMWKLAAENILFMEKTTWEVCANKLVKWVGNNESTLITKIMYKYKEFTVPRFQNNSTVATRLVNQNNFAIASHKK